MESLIYIKDEKNIVKMNFEELDWVYFLTNAKFDKIMVKPKIYRIGSTKRPCVRESYLVSLGKLRKQPRPRSREDRVKKACSFHRRNHLKCSLTCELRFLEIVKKKFPGISCEEIQYEYPNE